MLTNDDPDRLDLIEAELNAWSDVPWTRVTVAWLVGELRAERSRTEELRERVEGLVQVTVQQNVDLGYTADERDEAERAVQWALPVAVSFDPKLRGTLGYAQANAVLERRTNRLYHPGRAVDTTSIGTRDA